MSSADRAALAAALRDGRVQVNGLADLAGRTGTLMGAPAGAAELTLLAPVGTAVESDRPVFRWTALPDATNYVVAVFDQDFEEVARSGETTSREWMPGTPLKRGTLYMWQVTANTPHGRVQVPVPPAPEARFRVVTAATVARLAEVREAASGSHLALGVSYARAGLRDAAEQEFLALRDANPDSPIAKSLLASVQR